MDEPTVSGVAASPRADTDAFNPARALRSVCDDVRVVLGWSTALLLVDVEATRNCCLVAASGVPLELEAILLGAGVCTHGEIAATLRGGRRVGAARVHARLGAGTPLSLVEIVGSALGPREGDGYMAVVPVRARGRVAGALAAYMLGEGEELTEERARLLEMAARHAGCVVEAAGGALAPAARPADAAGAEEWDDLDAGVARALAEGNQALVLVDAGGAARWANAAAERLFGEDLAPLASVVDLVDSRDGARFRAALEEAARGGSRTVVARGRAGGELLLDLSPAVAGHAAALVLARDLTRVRSREAAGRAGRAAAGVAYRIAEEIVGSLARLEGERATRFALDQAARADALYRVGQRRFDRLAEPIELDALAAAAIEASRPLWEPQSRERGAVYEIRFEPAGAAVAVGCARELLEAIAQLVLNAVEAQPSGGVVDVRTVERRGIVAVQVRDAGPGVPAELRPRLFEPFLTTKGPAHRGLGLAHAAATAARHGGRVGVRSAPGQGAAFHLLLPAGAAAPPLVRARSVVYAESLPIRLRLLFALERAAMAPAWVESPHELVRAIDRLGPRAVLVDEAALSAGGEPLAAIASAAARSARWLVVGRVMPAAARSLLALPGVRLVEPGRLEAAVGALT